MIDCDEPERVPDQVLRAGCSSASGSPSLHIPDPEGDELTAYCDKLKRARNPLRKPIYVFPTAHRDWCSLCINEQQKRLARADGGQTHMGDLTAADGRLYLPDRYANAEKGIVVRQRRSTIDHKNGVHGDYSMWKGDSNECDDETAQNPNLGADEVQLKLYGEEPELYRVREVTTDGGAVRMSKPVSDVEDAEIVRCVCESCGDIRGSWEGEEIAEILNDEGNIKQGYGGGCLSCDGTLVRWEFLKFEEAAHD
jgi:hypothetical protein